MKIDKSWWDMPIGLIFGFTIGQIIKGNDHWAIIWLTVMALFIWIRAINQ